MNPFDVGGSNRKWVELPTHRSWLLGQANDLLAFYERSIIDPRGGFFDLDDLGAAVGDGAGGGRARQLFATCRYVHIYALARLMGRPGADVVIDHGMNFLWNGCRDQRYGGYFWAVGDDGPTDGAKQAYGHAFVLLAAASAKVAGHPDADRLLGDVTQVLLERFWEDGHGAAAEEFTGDWRPLSAYRGQNANMHLTEALMAAFEATAEGSYLRMAERIADLIVRRRAAENGWRLPEHFTTDWRVDRDYAGSPMLRPYGTTPGYWLEWSRLMLQLWELGGRKLDWALDAARALFGQAVAEGWDRDKGGFYYTLEWDGRPRIRDRYWWPCAEGVGAAAYLNAIDGAPEYETWYRRIWDFIAACFIDRQHGAWRAQLDANLKPNSDPFFGKVDVYHSVQACLIPLLPTKNGLAAGLAGAGVTLVA